MNKHTKNNCIAANVIITMEGLQCGNCLAVLNADSVGKAIGSNGGKKSAQKRFAGKSKKEISEMMRKVRKQSEQIGKDALEGVRNIKPV